MVGQEQARQGVLWLEGGSLGGDHCGLMTLSPAVLLLLTSFEVASELWEAHFSLCFIAMEKRSSTPDDTLVPDIYGSKELAIKFDVF